MESRTHFAANFFFLMNCVTHNDGEGQSTMNGQPDDDRGKVVAQLLESLADVLHLGGILKILKFYFVLHNGAKSV